MLFLFLSGLKLKNEIDAHFHSVKEISIWVAWLQKTGNGRRAGTSRVRGGEGGLKRRERVIQAQIH